MVTACPRCQDTFAPERRCPRCDGVRAAETSSHAEASRWKHGRWHEEPSSRLLLCPLMILGLCYALLLLASAIQCGLLGDAADSALRPRLGFALFILLQAGAVGMLSPLVGIGHKRGYLYGGVVGLGTGLVTGLATAAGLTTEVAQPFLRLAAPAPETLVWLLPVTHCLCGCIGGWLGSRIWQPLPVLIIPRDMAPATGLDGELALAVNTRPKGARLWTGPIAWTRVGLGVLVAFLGVVCAGEIIECAVDAGEGYFKVVNQSQNRVVLNEVFALSLLLGGCIAGASTPNGLKQGFCVGLASAAGMFGLMASGVLESSGALPAPVCWALLIGPIGGWFGTELLPPVIRRPTRARRR